jgi:dTDP-4-dehydrorhamnose 3,5-epimerase
VRFEETRLAGAYVVEPQPREDERGFFARAWCEREFSEHNLASRMVQANISGSRKRGTLRGLHYQTAPHEEAKLVRCTRGAIYDVIVDLRSGSPSCAQWFGIELTADNRRMLYIPEGFAHGYQTLADDTEVTYQVSAFYAPDVERGLRWNDSAFGIEWPITDDVTLSEKDKAWPDYLATE